MGDAVVICVRRFGARAGSGLGGLLRVAAARAAVTAGAAGAPGAGVRRGAAGVGAAVLRRRLRLAPVVRAVEPRALVMHGHRVEHTLERPLAAHLACTRPILAHAVEHLEEVSVGAPVLVDRHGSGKATSEVPRLRSRRVKRALLVLVLVTLAAPSAAAAHAT